jgi:hypothetical protein
MLPSSEKFHDLGLVFFGREEEDRKMAATVRERRTMTREQ